MCRVAILDAYSVKEIEYFRFILCKFRHSFDLIRFDECDRRLHAKCFTMTFNQAKVPIAVDQV